MIANHGYTDGSGSYYISIDTDRCALCAEHPCVAACSQQVFEIIVDDYDEQVAAVRPDVRNALKYTCALCKPTDRPPLPCVSACPADAITHSW